MCKKDGVSLCVMTREMCHTFYQGFHNDPAIGHYYEYVYLPDVVDRYFDKNTVPHRKLFAIVADGQIVGECKLKNIDPVKRECSLGIHLRDDSVKGKGFGTQAERLLLRFAFGELGMDFVNADTVLNNTRSQHVLEKVGFEFTGRDDTFCYYQLSRQAYENREILDSEEIAMKPITAVVLGAGSRGSIYASYAKEYPEQLKIVAIAEPRRDRLDALADEVNVSLENRFSDWRALLDKPRMADCAFICTLDDDHTSPALKAMELGYHILLEKPMSNTEDECRAISEAAERTQRTLAVCHVLRYTPFYMTIKALLDKGEIGKVTTINQIENVGYWHQAHSFVRGNWRTTRETSPMILQKSCHDMDILVWLMGKKCLQVQSFGSLRHFTAENAPAGAPARCLEGCPHADTCPYYAPKLYMDMSRTGWPVDVITTDMSLEGRRKALEEGPYGRCVYHCDNDVVDRQVVNLAFENGAVATFTMTGLSADFSRQIKIFGTRGQIQADMATKEIVLHRFGEEKRVIPLDMGGETSGHGGGDFGIMRDFLNVLRAGGESRTNASVSLESHLICFAAERSRKENSVVML